MWLISDKFEKLTTDFFFMFDFEKKDDTDLGHDVKFIFIEEVMTIFVKI